MMPSNPTTTLRLNRPFDADGRWVDAIVFDGSPGSVPLPVSIDDNGAEMDSRAFAYAMARATGLTMAAITQMDAIDRMALALLLFAPVRELGQGQGQGQTKRSRHGR